MDNWEGSKYRPYKGVRLFIGCLYSIAAIGGLIGAAIGVMFIAGGSRDNPGTVLLAASIGGGLTLLILHRVLFLLTDIAESLQMLTIEQRRKLEEKPPEEKPQSVIRPLQ